MSARDGGSDVEERWTPWRMEFISTHAAASGCVFCELPKQLDSESFILHRGETTFTVLNRYPYAVGHLMVIPFRHAARLHELTEVERREVSRELVRAEGALRSEYDAGDFVSGINLERAAGAGVVGHLHAHLLPRSRSRAELDGPDSALCESLATTFARLLPFYAGG